MEAAKRAQAFERDMLLTDDQNLVAEMEGKGMTFVDVDGGDFAAKAKDAVVASVYAFVAGTFVYRDLPIRAVPRIMIDSAVSSAAILVLVGFANVVGWILVLERIPQAIASAALSITENKYLVILPINLLLLVIGMFMEAIAALIILFVPLLTLAQGGRRRSAALRDFRRAEPDDRADHAAGGGLPLRLRQHRAAAAYPRGADHRAIPAYQHPRAAAGFLRAGGRHLAPHRRPALEKAHGNARPPPPRQACPEGRGTHHALRAEVLMIVHGAPRVFSDRYGCTWAS